MEKLPMCRICLVHNVRMYVVANRNMQELYEKLTDIPFVTEDRRPMLACFFCCTKLKQCCRLMTKCLEAEELFAQMMNEDYELNPLINQDHLDFLGGFIISPVVHISIVDKCQTESIAVKEEFPTVCEGLDIIIEPKEEHQSDELQPENFDNCVWGMSDHYDCLDVADVRVPPHNSKSDLEDDVPLKEFKTEVEEEKKVSKKKRKARQTKRADCEWDGVKGKCVKETQCLTTLDTRGDKHLVCSKKGDVTIVCCTDCELVNNTRNVVMSPTTGFYWKDGTKARDSCLEYLDELPYKCREGGFYSGISKNFDKEKKCHKIGLWGIGGAPPPGYKSGAEYPHQAMLGYGDDLASAKWLAGGSIISNKYILTAAHVNSFAGQNHVLKFVALGVEKRSDGPTAWQTHKVKRFIAHPDYKAPSMYNDIALIETETPITFNKNVLPACLHVAEANAETAIATTWRDLKLTSNSNLADEIQTIHLDEITEEDCKTAYAHPSDILKEGINSNTQMCYGSKSYAPEACKTLSGEPLLITTQFSRCIYTIIGVTSFGESGCSNNRARVPDVFTRVAYYKSWIESVVWA